MQEPVLRAMWFALFASVALILGGFVVGYGTAILAGQPAASVPAPPPLPTLAPAPGTDIAKQTVALQEPSVPDVTTGGLPPGAAASAAPPEPAPPQSPGPQGLTVSLDSVDVNTAQGGVEVVLQLRNNSGRSVSLSFWPADDLGLFDSRGHQYELRWSEFDGTIRVPPKGTVRLVRAFFAGTPAAGTSYLTVVVEHQPQLPSRSWEVPLSQ